MTFDYFFENEAHEKGYLNVCGIDEAGRGPLAGNVVAAAVILPKGLVIDGLDDSKKLSEKKREALFDIIQKESVSFSVAWATPREIDELNILGATMLAMHRAVEGLDIPADFALIDGNTARGFSIPVKTIVKGDAKSPSIAAASILAKVTRDRIMREWDKVYPQYGFERHKGYGTAAHIAAIKECGLCPIHRRSFTTHFI